MFGFNANEGLGWFHNGGGKELFEELQTKTKIMNVNIKQRSAQRPERRDELGSPRGEKERAMTNLITGLVGLALMITFLGILVVWIKAVPLIIIVVGVVILAVLDFVQSLRTTNGTPR